MNILYFIGNGFDINLGMKTRYTDFYQYYQSCDSRDELISNLKKSIGSGIDNWSDLELAFGKHTSKLANLEDFDTVYYDIADELGDFLEDAESKFDYSKINIERFLYDLSKPENSLTNQDISEFKTYRDQWANYSWHTNIITFNYTRILEGIFQDKQIDVGIGIHHSNTAIKLDSIQHIHGYTNKNMVLGVNDSSQVENANFHKNPDILEALVKTDCNRAQRHNIDQTCSRLIEKANLICIFGSSLGETDLYWWQQIGNQLRKGCKLIIFSVGEPIKERFAHKAARSKRIVKQVFLGRTDLTDQEKKDFEQQIYVV